MTRMPDKCRCLLAGGQPLLEALANTDEVCFQLLVIQGIDVKRLRSLSLTYEFPERAADPVWAQGVWFLNGSSVAKEGCSLHQQLMDLGMSSGDTVLDVAGQACAVMH